MRWILVFLFLYIIPLWMLFKNRKSFKRSSIYASMYVVVSSVIVISNIYISTLNKIESIIDYQTYASDEKYIKKNSDIEKEEAKKDLTISDFDSNNYVEVEQEAHNMEFKDEYDLSETEVIVSDAEAVNKFKGEIYEIERQALIPMRECMPDLKNIDINQESISSAKEDVKYAKSMCDKVVNIYEDMSIPSLSKSEYMETLDKAKVNVQKAYMLRSKAMESSEKLLNTKNLKYIGEIKEYLRLSDEQIKSFVDSTKELQNKLK